MKKIIMTPNGVKSDYYDWWKPVPLPTGRTRLKGYVELVAMLSSTAGGGATWEIKKRGKILSCHCNNRMAQYFSLGSYNPVFKGIVKNPVVVVAMQGQYDIDFYEKQFKYYVKQEFLYGNNHLVAKMVVATNYMRPVTVDNRLAATVHELTHSELDCLQGHQGHLEIYDACKYSVISKHLCKDYNSIDDFILEYDFLMFGKYNFKRRILLNHEIWGSAVIISKMRLDNYAHALVISKGDGWIVSPDHPEEPFMLKRGVYIIRHPIPQPERPVD